MGLGKNVRGGQETVGVVVLAGNCRKPKSTARNRFQLPETARIPVCMR